MKSHIRFMIVLCLTTLVAHTQNYSASLVNVGDPAPPIRVHTWIKGMPVNTFEKGKIYVVDFWATWCRPCIASMPELSALARKYKDSVIVLGIDIYEEQKTTLSKIKSFVDSMGQNMDYSVALGDSTHIVNDWLIATGEKEMGIPRVFIIDREGRLAWIGHPCESLEYVLSTIVNNTWNIKESSAKKKLEFRLISLQDSLIYELEFAPNGNFRSAGWTRDSALLLIDEIARTVPLIKYTPRVAYQVFSILLKANTKKAIEFGKEVIKTSTYEEPAGFIIRGAIENLSKEMTLSSEIYQLGIEAINVELNQALSCFPELHSIHKHYYRMAAWYSILRNKSRAIEAQKKAIEIMKVKNNYSAADLADYEARLKQYKTM